LSSVCDKNGKPIVDPNDLIGTNMLGENPPLMVGAGTMRVIPPVVSAL
jgi:hypothetical protein